jgi:hypothetical protein
LPRDPSKEEMEREVTINLEVYTDNWGDKCQALIMDWPRALPFRLVFVLFGILKVEVREARKTWL